VQVRRKKNENEVEVLDIDRPRQSRVLYEFECTRSWMDWDVDRCGACLTANGGINVRLSPGLTGCVSQSGYGSVYASIYPDHPGLKQIKADLTVAFLNGNRVALWLKDAICTVEIIRPS
jgi:hypothetical protein